MMTMMMTGMCGPACRARQILHHQPKKKRRHGAPASPEIEGSREIDGADGRAVRIVAGQRHSEHVLSPCGRRGDARRHDTEECRCSASWRKGLSLAHNTHIQHGEKPQAPLRRYGNTENHTSYKLPQSSQKKKTTACNLPRLQHLSP